MIDNPKISDDEIFTVSISHDMETRNMLRAGLVKAQNKDGDKIPLFVSWPEWLDDGIVCLYAQDFLRILKDTVNETASALGTVIEDTHKKNK